MSQTYTLKFPFTTAAGTRIERIEMRRLLRKDLKAAMQFSKDDIEQEDFLLARLSGMTGLRSIPFWRAFARFGAGLKTFSNRWRMWVAKPRAWGCGLARH